MKRPLETSLAYKYFVAYRLYDGQRFDEIVIPYRPRNSFQKKMRKFIGQYNWLPSVVFAFCLTAYCLNNNGWIVAILVLLVGLIWMLFEMYISMQPTHFALSSKGLRLYWIRWFGDKSSPYIPWDKISHVCLRRKKEIIYKEAYIDFDSTTQSGRSLVSLRLDGIITGEQRKRLHLALQKHIKGECIALDLNDTLNPVKTDNYTSLWLEVLATTPQRSKHEALTRHTLIANNRYEILGQIGSGGQGTAYLARCRNGAHGPGSPAMDVVLKEFVLPYQGGLSVSKKALEQIEHEAYLLKHLAHPQIVRLVDLFVEDQRAYLVLEHIEGDSLRHLVEENGPYSQQQIVQLAIQMCEILSHLHNQQPPVLHRDFTPENLIMGVDGYLKLIDFNVAQQMHSNATRTVVGKHSYIPPEQFRGRATTQSDLYAMGASLYFLLTGKDPEPITTAHPALINNALSPVLDGIIAGCTAVDPEIRYKSAEEAKQELIQLDKCLNTGESDDRGSDRTLS